MAKVFTPLAPNVPIVDENGNPTPYFQQIMQELTDTKINASLIDALGGDPDEDAVVIWDDTAGELAFVPNDELLSLDDLTDVDTSTTPPTDGQTLVWVDADSEWAPGDVSGSGGNWWFIPPSAVDFPTAYGTGGTTGAVTLSDDADVGLCVNGGAVADPAVRASLKALPAGNWVATMRVVGFVTLTNFSSFGFAVVNAARDKLTMHNIDSRQGFRTENWNNSTFVSQPSMENFYLAPNPFMRLTYTSATNTYVWALSNDGKNFTDIFTYVNTHIGAGPGYIGVNAVYSRTTGPVIKYSVPYWVQSW